jgi:phosphate transport system protein
MVLSANTASSGYRQELVDLRQLLLEMGGVTEECLATSIEALLAPEQPLIERCKQLERETNALEKSIDERCMRILAVHQPAASELRFVAMAMKIVTDLERIADLSSNIAGRARHLLGRDGFLLPPELVRMSRAVRDMIALALDAFVERSVDRANEVLQRDDEVDRLQKEAFERIGRQMEASPEAVADGIRMIHCARDLERAGDHATNIAEGVIFMIRGRDVRHSG